MILDKSQKINQNNRERAYGIVVTQDHGMIQSGVRFPLGPLDPFDKLRVALSGSKDDKLVTSHLVQGPQGPIV